MNKYKALIAATALISGIIVVCIKYPLGRSPKSDEAAMSANHDYDSAPRSQAPAANLTLPDDPADRQSAPPPETKVEPVADPSRTVQPRDRDTLLAELRKAARKDDTRQSKRLMIELKLREFQEAPDMEKLDAAKNLTAMSIAEILRAQGRAWPSSKRRPQGGANWDGGERFFVYNGDAFYFYLDEFPEFGKIQEARSERRRAQKQGGLGVGPTGGEASDDVYATVVHRALVAMDLLSN